ncbi:MAG: ectoine/hydroxyectoine ABC transporter substrate-binding protein EhuB [Proteobacteria bacterium]|nr:ectoine/hydroxyectoine ABC transporter substrate-binding protein EhuB [Pseudomonadota bacterium]
MSKNSAVGPVGIGLVVVIAAVVAYIVLGSSSDHQQRGDSTLERIRAEGVIRIGYANEAPYGYLDSKSGKVTGEAPEIARVILAKMGISRIEPVVTEFGSLIPGLKAGRFDLIAAGMYITPQRCKEIGFTNPTYVIGESFVVEKGNPHDLHSYRDVANKGDVRLGVVGGTVEHGYAKSLGVPENRIVVFPDGPSALAGITGKRVDAFAGTILTVDDLLAKAGDDRLERAEPFTDPVIEGKPARGYGAFGARKEDGELIAEFNRHLSQFIGSKEHLELIKPFGFSADTLPGEASAKELCAGT